MSRPHLEVADVVQQYGDAFLIRYGATLSGAQHRVLRAIATCRTAVLGGHTIQCDHCGHAESSYNSCRNWHCPKCHGAAQATWLAAREREVLDVPYVHVVFTLPHTLSPLALQNPRVLYSILFRTVAQTLQDIAGDSKHLGAEIGGLAVLHTWGQQLHHHPHLHCVLPAGGLAPDATRWIPCRPHFFLPAKVLSRRFRRLFLDALEQAAGRGALTLTGRCQSLATPQPWQRFLAALRHTEWVVYAKEPLRTPQHVLKYLARYTHRVAISNQRLMALEDGQVTFRWKDYKRGHRLRTMTLDAVEFLRRFLLHVLPHGFQRIRHFGFLANRVRQAKLAQCRTLLQQPEPRILTSKEAPRIDAKTVRPAVTSVVCPVCQQGHMQLVETLSPHRAARDLSVPIPLYDTS
jgi:hypothetical protein